MATVFFDGYVEVQNNNVIAVYNNHNFNNNLLYPLQGSIVPPDPNEWGFTNYQNNVLYDNAYRSGVWSNYDTYGLIINSDAAINAAFYNSNYAYYNFSANTTPFDPVGRLIGFNATGPTSIPRTVTMNFTPSPNPICFNYDTKILCMNKSFTSEDNKDMYIPIQNIRKNTFVKTYKHGYKKVKEIKTGQLKNNPEKPYKAMHVMEKNETNNLTEDLIVTGAHSILQDKMTRAEYKKQGKAEKIDDKFLVNACSSSKFSIINDNKMYTYYHIILEGDRKYGIWANGLLTESTV